MSCSHHIVQSGKITSCCFKTYERQHVTQSLLLFQNYVFYNFALGDDGMALCLFIVIFLLAEFLFPKMESSKKMDSAGTLQPNPPLKLQPDRSAGSVFVPDQGGYKEKFVKTVEDKYKCEKCRLVLCNPKQTECGHRFCESCMTALLRWVSHTPWPSDLACCACPHPPTTSYFFPSKVKLEPSASRSCL